MNLQTETWEYGKHIWGTARRPVQSQTEQTVVGRLLNKFRMLSGRQTESCRPWEGLWILVWMKWKPLELDALIFSAGYCFLSPGLPCNRQIILILPLTGISQNPSHKGNQCVCMCVCECVCVSHCSPLLMTPFKVLWQAISIESKWKKTKHFKLYLRKCRSIILKIITIIYF